MLLLKHFRDWNFAVLSRQVGVNLVYREFTGSEATKFPATKPWVGLPANGVPK